MVLVIDSTDLDLGKHAYSQMKDFGVDAEVVEIDGLDAPRRMSRSDEKVLFIFDTGQNFAEQVVGKVLDLEEEIHVEKVFVEQEDESQEVFERRAKNRTREKAEKLAEKA
jgi:tryptophanyl-tRNA synthetase